ncbi:hypothetical protein [Mycobacterium neumannii]|nr:hypothetical protein [Mycobacterium neumannii]
MGDTRRRRLGIALKQLRDGTPPIEAWAATVGFVNEIDRVQ